MNRGLPLPAFLIPADYLARLLHQGDIGWGVMLAGVVVAFALGGIHALSPGHGKTIVAAYLVGTRGTPLHAAILGGMVTFTHTVTVFCLGFATLFLSRYVLPERIYPVLGAISGISIVLIGAALLYQRVRSLPHSHDHGDGHVHSHSHMAEGEAGMASLVALGASGGLVPCPSALVLLLTAVSLGRTGLGLILLVAFSAGLAVVLTATGLVVLYAKHWLPDGQKAASHAVFRYLPVVSAAIIVGIGVAMTWVSLRRG
jgi:ABC-type nickel/cobalt efflux system permease component RcnA